MKMSTRDLTYFRIGLDDETVARLMEICDEAHVEPAVRKAALVSGVLEEDFEAHHVPAGYSPDKPLH